MSIERWPTSPTPWIMGILNATPDSFSDGGRYFDPEVATEHAKRMIDAGAHILDVGGESTRPGSLPVPEEEQIRRTIPIIVSIRRNWGCPISIDTTSASVVDAAISAGANWVNDISALRDDVRMVDVVARHGCPVVLMHRQGTSRSMQVNPSYADVVAEVRGFLVARAEFAEQHGVSRENIILDPGIGFGKSIEHNLELLRCLPEIVAIGYRVLVGTSRKSFIGHLADVPVDQRLAGSLAAAVKSVEAGATIVRVHDVGPTMQALIVARAISHL